MRFIIPAENIIDRITDLFCFIMQQMILRIMNIQVIYYQYTSCIQAFGNGADGIVMFPSCFKIAKTGKEIKSIIIIIHPERQAHIMYIKTQVIFFKLLGKGDTVGRNVNSYYFKTQGRQCYTMSSFATGHIEDAAAWSGLQVADQFFDKCFGLLFIPFKI